PRLSRHSSLLLLCACSRAPRHLHSFPTRRSSDLVERAARVGRRRIGAAPGVPARRLFRRLGGRGGGGAAVALRIRPARSRRVARDRKSTRLNSSHQIISYAVFCLKKKIQHI